MFIFGTHALSLLTSSSFIKIGVCFLVNSLCGRTLQCQMLKTIYCVFLGRLQVCRHVVFRSIASHMGHLCQECCVPCKAESQEEASIPLTEHILYESCRCSRNSSVSERADSTTICSSAIHARRYVYKTVRANQVFCPSISIGCVAKVRRLMILPEPGHCVHR